MEHDMPLRRIIAETWEDGFGHLVTDDTDFLPEGTFVGEAGEDGPRHLVLCFDGTENEVSNYDTNALKFFRCLSKDRKNQKVYYQTGIGTYTHPWLATKPVIYFSKKLDSAIAWNLEHHVQDAYRFLMQYYEEGDKVSLFGFSRGAYTARVLAGFLQKVGLLPQGNVAQIPFVWKHFVSSDRKEGRDLCRAYKSSICREVKITFLGLWDTVASVGVSGRELPLIDPEDSGICFFRQALALDEHRVDYRPNYKDNFNTNVNANVDVKEVWFAGSHSDVGGGAVRNGTRNSLSRISLRWMIRECLQAHTGIQFDLPWLVRIGFVDIPDPDYEGVTEIPDVLQVRNNVVYAVQTAAVHEARAAAVHEVAKAARFAITEAAEHVLITAPGQVRDEVKKAANRVFGAAAKYVAREAAERAGMFRATVNDAFAHAVINVEQAIADNVDHLQMVEAVVQRVDAEVDLAFTAANDHEVTDAVICTRIFRDAAVCMVRDMTGDAAGRESRDKIVAAVKNATEDQVRGVEERFRTTEDDIRRAELEIHRAELDDITAELTRRKTGFAIARHTINSIGAAAKVTAGRIRLELESKPQPKHGGLAGSPVRDITLSILRFAVFLLARFIALTCLGVWMLLRVILAPLWYVCLLFWHMLPVNFKGAIGNAIRYAWKTVKQAFGHAWRSIKDIVRRAPRVVKEVLRRLFHRFTPNPDPPLDLEPGLHGDYTQHDEDTSDVLSPIHDQFWRNIIWLVIDLVPRVVRLQETGGGKNRKEKKTLLNGGRGREIYGDAWNEDGNGNGKFIYVHESVFTRMKESAHRQMQKKYKPRAWFRYPGGSNDKFCWDGVGVNTRKEQLTAKGWEHVRWVG
ncbi:hypothetical protein ACEPAI_9594 [Sanghuangporus weigelae]